MMTISTEKTEQFGSQTGCFGFQLESYISIQQSYFFIYELKFKVIK